MKYIILSIIIFFSSNTFASITDYNNGKADGQKLKGTGKDAYLNYFSKIRECSRISGTVYHPGDNRFSSEVCHYTLGIKDGYHGSTSSLDVCDKKTTPSDITVDSITSCTSSIINQASSFCSNANVTTSVGNTTATFSLKEAPEDTVRNVDANNNGDSCGTNAYIKCKYEAMCSNGSWQQRDIACRCITRRMGDMLPLCKLPSPSGKHHCRCGKWVTFETWKRTQEC